MKWIPLPFLILILLMVSCHSEDICPERDYAFFYPSDTTWMNRFGSQKTRSLKSNVGNFQSITNSGVIGNVEIERRNGNRLDVERCRRYFKQTRGFNSRTSIYGILVDYQLVFEPEKKLYYFELVARDYEPLGTFMTHKYVLHNPDVNQTFDFNFHSTNFDTSYSLIPQKFESFTNENGITFKEVFLFEFPFIYLSNSPAGLRRIWFSKYEGIIAYQTLGGEKWDCFN